MNAEQPNFCFERWWWRAWYVFFALAFVWLAYCGWLARPLQPWARGWVGWWTGDQMGSRPLWNFHLHTADGAEVARIEGNPAFRNSDGTFTELGHWAEEGEQWTWAGWVKVATPNGLWPTNFLVFRTAKSPNFNLQMGIEDGHAAIVIRTGISIRDVRLPTHLVSTQLVPFNQWVHLAFSANRRLERLVLNGVLIAERLDYLHEGIGLSDLRLTSDVFHIPTRRDLLVPCTVEQDDIVAFDRVLPLEELAALAARGRGGLLPELGRPVRAAQMWSRGWPLALFILAIFLFLKLLPGAREKLLKNLRMVLQPAFGPIRWTLVTGAVISVLVASAIGWQGKRADEERFAERLRRFAQDMRTDWGQLAGLLTRAKDWIASQTNLDQPSWEVWLHANRFPYDYPGAIGIGYAQQVLPEEVAVQEAEWSRKHGFAYRVHPPLSSPRQPVVELAGNPRLPVVLYNAPRVEKDLWLTNETILGRDLLFQAVDDKRAWAEARRVEEVAARNEVQTSSLEEIAPAVWYGTALRGLHLYVPWTLTNKNDSSKRILPSASWHGVVFASVDVTRELEGFFPSGASPIGFRLYTTSTVGERFDLLADSANFLPGTADRKNTYLRQTIVIPFYYRRLLLEAWTTPTFEAQSMRRWPWIAGAAGGTFTLLVASLLFVQVRARETQAGVLEALRVANSKLLQAAREREDLSRDLHDGSIQNLYALGLHLQRVKALLISAPERVSGELEDSLGMLDSSISELRQFILSAGVETLPRHSVKSAIEGFVQRLRKTTKIDLRVDFDEHVSLDPAASVHVLQIVREAVSNSVRHAGTTRIEISLKRTAENASERAGWHLAVSDEGCGFEVEKVNGHGSGLKNVASRAADLQGRSEITSRPGHGTRIIVQFPDSGPI
jgi:signal transduction histidine kinase